MPAKVAVLGAGSWGTTMAALLSRRTPVVLWARRAALADQIDRHHCNPDYLPDVALPAALRATGSLEVALAGAEVVVMAVPSHGFRAILSEALPHLAGGVPIVSLAKGVEEGTLQRMSEVVAELAPEHPRGVLTGPNLSSEVMAGHPTATVVAVTAGTGEDQALAVELQRLFSTETLRVYTNPDIVGCELGGALKNVVAIAAGMADGMGFGDNTRAALVTRGLAELSRLGVALGGDPLTFAGLAGMGDLVATCISRHSRNRWVGEQLAKGRLIREVVTGTRMVAEGVRSSRAVVDLATSVGVEMPVAEQVAAVVHDGKSAADVLATLMQREMKAELMGPGTRVFQ